MAQVPSFHITAIGNAIVDVLAEGEEAFLWVEGLNQGAMTLVDAGQSESLYRKMKAPQECSGGSAANTAAGFASLGGKAAYIGKVKKDGAGDIFRKDMAEIGVYYPTPAAMNGSATARCMIFVTHTHNKPERTMATYLGACREITPEDIDEKLIANSAITYLEGYLWDEPEAKQAIRKAMRVAKQAGRKVAFTLSDAFCVHRHLDEFHEIIKNDVDILFANEEEAKALTDAKDFDTAARAIAGLCEVIALTRSEKGSVIISGEANHPIEAAPVKEVVDVTGAGDLYAAGFLYGYTHFNGDLMRCGKLGSLAAAEVIQHLGARVPYSLTQLATYA